MKKIITLLPDPSLVTTHELLRFSSATSRELTIRGIAKQKARKRLEAKRDAKKG
jgi:hypothetical protein